MYDPEATIQDADIEMAEAYELSRIVEARRRAGICSHTSSVGRSSTGKIHHEGQVGLEVGEVRCTDLCGRKFANDQEMYDDAGIW